MSLACWKETATIARCGRRHFKGTSRGSPGAFKHQLQRELKVGLALRRFLCPEQVATNATASEGLEPTETEGFSLVSHPRARPPPPRAPPYLRCRGAAPPSSAAGSPKRRQGSALPGSPSRSPTRPPRPRSRGAHRRATPGGSRWRGARTGTRPGGRRAGRLRGAAGGEEPPDPPPPPRLGPPGPPRPLLRGARAQGARGHQPMRAKDVPGEPMGTSETRARDPRPPLTVP